MEQNTQHQVKVGLFVFLGVAATLVSIILLGGDRSFFKSFTTLYVMMPQVQGLNEGSVVSLSGITIGNVSKLEFWPETHSLRVALKIERSYLREIKHDATVELRTQGALGDKFLFIQPGSANQPSVAAGDTIQTEKSSDLLDVLSGHTEDAEKLFDVIRETHKLITSINSDGKMQKIMANIMEASADLKAASAEARKVMQEVKPQSATELREGLEHLNSVLTKIDQGQGTLGALVNDKSLYRSLKAVLSNDNQQNYMKSMLRTSIKQSSP